MIEVSEPWFGHICAGVKTVKGRKGSSKWRAIAPGDSVLLVNGATRVEAVVVCTKHYPSVREYLAREGLSRTLPGVDSLAAGEAVYAAWWSAEDVARDGVLAITIALR